jgi:hypothetical protein
MDLLQLLILLTITGICGAFAVFCFGFSPRGVMILLFSVIAGTIGAALGIGFKGFFSFPDILPIKIGTIRMDIVLTFVFSLLVVGGLHLAQNLLVGAEPQTLGVQDQES